jgi:Tfp pilus assembly protein PilE
MNPNLLLISVVGGVISLIVGSETKTDVLAFLGIVALIFSAIYWLICLHKCWSIIQGFGARTTPGKAVGYLFIPFYNLYWAFVAYKGLADDANTFARKYGVGKEINAGLSMAIAITSIIPYLNIIIAPILANILIYQWANLYNAVVVNYDKLSPVDSTEVPPPHKGDIIPIVIAVVIGGIFVIGILAAIAIPQFVVYKERGYCALAKSDLKNAYLASQAYFADNPEGVVSVDALRNSGYQQSKNVDLYVVKGYQFDLAMGADHNSCKKVYVVDSTGTISEVPK